MPPSRDSRTAAIVVAAGRSRRMGGPLPKQVLPLAGRPLVEHALRAFQSSPEVDRIVLVVPAKLRALFPLRLGSYDKLADVVDGGETRRGSVARGLEAVPDADWILVHDGARPLVSHELIGRVLEAAHRGGASVPACEVSDTVKRVEGERVGGTVDRSGLVLVQTPQAFRADLLRRAHREAAAAGFEGTDDAQLVERLGEPVIRVNGSPANLKVTTPEDLRMAEALLRGGIAGHGRERAGG